MRRSLGFECHKQAGTSVPFQRRYDSSFQDFLSQMGSWAAARAAERHRSNCRSTVQESRQSVWQRGRRGANERQSGRTGEHVPAVSQADRPSSTMFHRGCGSRAMPSREMPGNGFSMLVGRECGEFGDCGCLLSSGRLLDVFWTSE